MSELSEILRKEFKDKESAHAYIEEFLNTCIATQIKVLREQRGWTQKKLAHETGMEQSRISLLENINYDKWSISTLKKLARAFDITLNVSFETFSNRIDDVDDFSRESLERVSRAEDLASEQQIKLNGKSLSSHLTLIVNNDISGSSEFEVRTQVPYAQSNKDIEVAPPQSLDTSVGDLNGKENNAYKTQVI